MSVDAYLCTTIYDKTSTLTRTKHKYFKLSLSDVVVRNACLPSPILGDNSKYTPNSLQMQFYLVKLTLKIHYSKRVSCDLPTRPLAVIWTITTLQ